MRSSPLLCFLLICGFFYKGQSQNIEFSFSDKKRKPIAQVFVTVNGQTAISDSSGSVFMEIVPKADTLEIRVRHISYRTIVDRVGTKGNKRVKISYTLTESSTELIAVDVIDETDRMEGKTVIKGRDIEFYSGPTSGVEGLIKTLPGVFSNSELSNQYNVRGGSFDENLVYVNGIEIYRPFLVRAGQQEGLSFINPDMVESVNFSAGGFEARYGDKMSSVLDIRYRKPTKFGVQTQASFLGGSVTAEGVSKDKKLGIIGSARYRTNQLLIGSLDTEADFRPQFTDIQTYITYDVSTRWELSFLGNYSRNIYNVVPVSRTTEFGTLQEALQVNIFFEGNENYNFTTRFGSLSGKYQATDKLQMQFTGVVFQTVEEENFDVIGFYRLSELNNDLGSDDFGEIAFLRGVGGFQNFGRNTLDALVYNFDYQASYIDTDNSWGWGLKWQGEDIIDRYKEFERIDSAGYSVPFVGPSDQDLIDRNIQYAEGLELFEHFDTRSSILSQRVMAYVENNRSWEKNGHSFRVNLGVRAQYWSLNGQTIVSPRANFSWKPNWKADWVFRVASGYYQQPAFYREMRNLAGGVNRNIRAQQSIHLVAGADYGFRAKDRPFRLVTEVYHKQMNYLIPYEIDNVRLRYSAVNEAVGFATGIDTRIHGEFIPGTESWASFSLFTVQENIDNDGAGYIPRPTDNHFSFSIFFQDRLPKDASSRVSVTLFLGGGFPHGPPQTPRKDQILRAPLYRRVDIGFIKVLKDEQVESKWKVMKPFKAFWVSAEVFNLLQIRNTVSYLWIRDASTANQYGVPNYLTNRLINLKVTAKF